MFKVKSDKDIHIRYVIAASVVAFSVVLIIASFAVPPTGVIDNSVLAALGEFLAFAGSCLGFSTSYEKKKLDIEKEINEKYIEKE